MNRKELKEVLTVVLGLNIGCVLGSAILGLGLHDTTYLVLMFMAGILVGICLLALKNLEERDTRDANKEKDDD